ncbi:unnamed protein product [Echinostoma caproni]|uniref:DUF3752 domain-containing protein n=1 Tax=Echinostoma caproni TaxID=27848 RepID=A0A183APD0_9TREM|nr:unnamed protein product [Echinostoma caproni]
MTTGLPSTGMKRDSWMTQLLPTSGSNIAAALKPRKFLQGVSGSGETGYDSSWFKTPGGDPSNVNEDPEAICGDKTQISLLDLHRKKLQKKSKKKETKHEDKNVEKKKKKKKKSKHKHKKEHLKKKKRHRRDSDSSTSDSDSSSNSSGSPSPLAPTVRRPFDRDKDLKISRMDSSARHALIERSKQLSSRFGHGSRQFL